MISPIYIDLRTSLEVLTVPDAAHILKMGSPSTLNKLIKNNPTYAKYFWKHGSDSITSPLCLMLMQLDLVGIDLGESLRDQALEHLRKAA